MDNNNNNNNSQAQQDANQPPNAAEQATQPTKPTVLRSHFKGMPKDWEKNKKANEEGAADQEKKPSDDEEK